MHYRPTKKLLQNSRDPLWQVNLTTPHFRGVRSCIRDTHRQTANNTIQLVQCVIVLFAFRGAYHLRMFTETPLPLSGYADVATQQRTREHVTRAAAASIARRSRHAQKKHIRLLLHIAPACRVVRACIQVRANNVVPIVRGRFAFV